MLSDGRLQGFKVGGQWRFSRQVIERWLQEQRGDLDVAESLQEGEQPGSPAEALPLYCIRAIQGLFAEALGVSGVTTKLDGTPLTPAANSCEFCNLILGSEAGRQLCVASWRAAAAQHDDVPRWDTCHAGLSYVSAHIEVQGQLVAAIHAGQFLDRPPDEEAWADRVTDLSAVAGVDREELRRALASVWVLDEGRRQQVAPLLHRVAATFAEIGEERLGLLGRLQRIAEISQVFPDEH
jgi:ligand-binding sensor protein